MNDGLGGPFTGADAKTALEAKKQVVIGNRILANEGVNDGFGHVTVRNPENPQTFFMSASVSPEFVALDDILELDLSGKVLTQTDKKPYGERFIHSEVFRLRRDVNAISHNHALPMLILSIADVPIQTVTHMGGMFFGGISYYDDYDVTNGTLGNTLEEGRRIAECLGKQRACVMRGHGTVVVGESIAHCMMSSIGLRDNCLAQIQALLLGGGKIHALSKALGSSAAQKNFAAVPLSRAWSYWAARAKKAMPDITNL